MMQQQQHYQHHQHRTHRDLHHQRLPRCCVTALLCLAVVAGSARGADEPPQRTMAERVRGGDEEAHRKWYATAMRVRSVLETLPDKEARRGNGAPALCAASLALSEVAVRRILSVDGVDGASNIMYKGRPFSSPLHCLGAALNGAGGVSGTPIVHTLLRRLPHWVTTAMDRTVEENKSEYAEADIAWRLRNRIGAIAKLLLKAGANPNLPDEAGRSPLHYAAISGLDSLATALLEGGADPNAVELIYGQTPMHITAVYGYASIAQAIIKHGGNVDLPDNVGNTFRAIATAAGTALTQFEVATVLNAPKVLLPTALAASTKVLAEKEHGDGGWNAAHRLPPPHGFSQRCDIPVINGSLYSATDLHQQFLAMNRPVLIRGFATRRSDGATARDNGAFEPPAAWAAYTKRNLLNKFGNYNVTASAIPYGKDYGSSAPPRSMSLRSFIEEMSNVPGQTNPDRQPDYVFMDHAVNKNGTRFADQEGSIVKQELLPMPAPIVQAFTRRAKLAVNGVNRMNAERATTTETAHESKGEVCTPAEALQWKVELLSNRQFAIGPAGSGAPIHHHLFAVNSLFYGAKHWFLFPPAYSVISNQHILEWIKDEEKGLEKYRKRVAINREAVEEANSKKKAGKTRDLDPFFRPYECVQRQGDIMIVPEKWGHGVVNIQESVAVAAEVREFMYSVGPIPPKIPGRSTLSLLNEHMYNEGIPGMGYPFIFAKEAEDEDEEEDEDDEDGEDYEDDDDDEDD